MAICLHCGRPRFHSWVRMMPWRRDGLHTPVFLDFPCGSAGEESACNVGDLGSIPGLGRSPGEGKGSPLQYSVPETLMDCTVHGVTKSRTRLSKSFFIPSLSLHGNSVFHCLRNLSPFLMMHPERVFKKYQSPHLNSKGLGVVRCFKK